MINLDDIMNLVKKWELLLTSAKYKSALKKLNKIIVLIFIHTIHPISKILFYRFLQKSKFDLNFSKITPINTLHHMGKTWPNLNLNNYLRVYMKT